MKKSLVPMLIAGLVISSANVHAAGFGFDSIKTLLPTGNKKTETVAAEQSADTDVIEDEVILTQQSEAVVYRYVQAVLRLADAQANFAEALGAKKEAEKLRKESEALSSSNYSKKDIKKQAVVSAKTNAVIQQKISEEQELSQEQRKIFSTGLVHYAIGLKETKEFGDEVGPFYKSMVAEGKSMSDPTSLAGMGTIFKKVTSAFDTKLLVIGYLTKKMPGFITDHKDTAIVVTEFAKNNDLQVPKEMEDLGWI